jgi:hypothetical protein
MLRLTLSSGRPGPVRWLALVALIGATVPGAYFVAPANGQPSPSGVHGTRLAVDPDRLRPLLEPRGGTAAGGDATVSRVSWDVDRDGDLDLVALTRAARLTIWLNDGRGRDAQAPPPTPVPKPHGRSLTGPRGASNDGAPLAESTRSPYGDLLVDVVRATLHDAGVIHLVVQRPPTHSARLERQPRAPPIDFPSTF